MADDIKRSAKKKGVEHKVNREKGQIKPIKL